MLKVGTRVYLCRAVCIRQGVWRSHPHFDKFGTITTAFRIGWSYAFERYAYTVLWDDEKSDSYLQNELVAC